MTPKISVLIPLYNRKQYAADCINSVLNQSFTDFELVIRDDFSTDGVFEFVSENFSDRRIKLFKNEKNLGEAQNLNLLLKAAEGKYFTILHNDDLYLPNALKDLFETAEKFGADVVHSSQVLISAKDTVIKKGVPLRKISFDNYPASKAEIVSNEPILRFNEWFEGRIFRDLQYNIFNRKFFIDNKIFSGAASENLLILSLNWIMNAKILVKTPLPFYIRRENSTSQSAAKNISDGEFENELSKRIEIFRKLDKFISNFELFRDNAKLQYKIKARIFGSYENLNFDKSRSYGNENFAEFYNLIENTFRKYFGDDAIYLAMMYHWAHLMHFNQNQFQDTLQNCLKILGKNI